MVKLFATAWHPSATNSLVPVIQELISDGAEVTTLGTRYSAPIFERANIPLSSFDIPDFSEESMRYLLTSTQPDVVLAGASFQEESERYVPDQTVLLAAKEEDIPSVRIHDWWNPFSKKYNDIFTGERHKFMPDKIALMDNYAKRKMLEEGFPESYLVITGNPEIESIMKKKENFGIDDREELTSKLGFLDREGVLYYTGGIAWLKNKQELGYTNQDNIKILLESLDRLKGRNVGLIIGLHPRTPEAEKEEVINLIEDSHDSRIKIDPDSDPLELSLATDATLTTFSSVGVKAAYMGKPCISLQPNLKWPSDFKDGEVGFFVDNQTIPLGRTREECIELVFMAFDSNYRKNLEGKLKESEFSKGAGAPRRIADITYSLAN